MPHESALSHCELTPVHGDALFARALARADYQTIHINPSCATYDDPRRGGELRMPCGWTPLWVAGIDPRPEARTLPVRLIAEISLAMRLSHRVRIASHRLTYLLGEYTARYEGNDINSQRHRQAFTLVGPQADLRDFLPQVSEVACGGQLAYMLDSKRSYL